MSLITVISSSHGSHFSTLAPDFRPGCRTGNGPSAPWSLILGSRESQSILPSNAPRSADPAGTDFAACGLLFTDLTTLPGTTLASRGHKMATQTARERG